MAERISVCARIRPQSTQELANYEELVLRTENRNIYLRTSHAGAATTKTFKLDCVLSDESNQTDVFNQVHPLLKSALTGINCSIFAYGQTGTGKTHTMLGYDLWKIAENESGDLTSQLACDQRSNDRGIIPRSMEYLFNALKVIHGSANSGPDSTLRCMITASYIEIYNEKLIDLLDCSDDCNNVQPLSTFAPGSQQSAANSHKVSLEIRNSKSDGVVVPGLTVLEVQSVNEVMECLWIGARKRNVASTNMNDYSSRSHTIFIVKLHFRETKLAESGGGAIVSSKTSKICFVDLAGSEKWRSVDMGSCGEDRVRELTSINKSLSALGNCISALVANSQKDKTDRDAGYVGSPNHSHIPYRDSKLTRLVQDSLGGNTRTFFIVTLSASKASAEETLSTLQFADRAMKVQIHATANVTTVGGGAAASAASQAAISALQEQIASLQVGHKQVVHRYQTEIVRLRSILKLLLVQQTPTVIGRCDKEGRSSSGAEANVIPEHIVSEITKYNMPPELNNDSVDVVTPVLSALDRLVGEECLCLREENVQLRESHQSAVAELAASKAEIKRILNIMYFSPADGQQALGEGSTSGSGLIGVETLELGPDGHNVGANGGSGEAITNHGKWAWLDSYHCWLKSQVTTGSCAGHRDSSATTVSDTDQATLTVDTSSDLNSESVTGTEAPVFTETGSDADLYGRIVMMETSVLMQAAELERTKQLFLKLQLSETERKQTAAADAGRGKVPNASTELSDEALLALPADISLDTGENFDVPPTPGPPAAETQSEAEAGTEAALSPDATNAEGTDADSCESELVYIRHPQGALPTPVSNPNTRSKLPIYDPSVYREVASRQGQTPGPTIRASLSELGSAVEKELVAAAASQDSLETDLIGMLAENDEEGEKIREQEKGQGTVTTAAAVANPADLLKLANSICSKHKTISPDGDASTASISNSNNNPKNSSGRASKANGTTVLKSATSRSVSAAAVITPMRKKASASSATTRSIYTTPGPPVIGPASTGVGVGVGRIAGPGKTSGAGTGVGLQTAPRSTGLKAAQSAQMAALAESRSSLNKARVSGSISKVKNVVSGLGPKMDIATASMTTIGTLVAPITAGKVLKSKKNDSSNKGNSSKSHGSGSSSRDSGSGEVGLLLSERSLGSTGTSLDSFDPSSYYGSGLEGEGEGEEEEEEEKQDQNQNQNQNQDQDQELEPDNDTGYYNYHSYYNSVASDDNDDDVSAASDELEGEMSQAQLIEMANSIFDRQAVSLALPAELVSSVASVPASVSAPAVETTASLPQHSPPGNDQKTVRFQSTTDGGIDKKELRGGELTENAVSASAFTPAVAVNSFEYKINKSVKSKPSAVFSTSEVSDTVAGATSEAVVKRPSVSITGAGGEISISSHIIKRQVQQPSSRTEPLDTDATVSLEETRLSDKIPTVPVMTTSDGDQDSVSDLTGEFKFKVKSKTKASASVDTGVSTGTTGAVSKKKSKVKRLWKEFIDPESSTKYYYNRATKETTWDRPTDRELALECCQ